MKKNHWQIIAFILFMMYLYILPNSGKEVILVEFLFFLTFVGLLVYASTPYYKMVKSEGKINELKPTTQKMIKIILRLLTLSIALFVFWFVLLPITRDLPQYFSASDKSYFGKITNVQNVSKRSFQKRIVLNDKEKFRYMRTSISSDVIGKTCRVDYYKHSRIVIELRCIK